MAYDPDNVFAKILRGQAPCIPVYEDAATLAFMDIMPEADGHVLVIPKEAAEGLLDLSDAAAQACIVVVRRLARAVQQASGQPGILVAQMNGAAAGQTVPHCHFHIIPRSPAAPRRGHARTRESDEKLHAMAEKIRACLKIEG